MTTLKDLGGSSRFAISLADVVPLDSCEKYIAGDSDAGTPSFIETPDGVRHPALTGKAGMAALAERQAQRAAAVADDDDAGDFTDEEVAALFHESMLK